MGRSALALRTGLDIVSGRSFHVRSRRGAESMTRSISISRSLIAIVGLSVLVASAINAQQAPAPPRDTLPDGPQIFDSSTRGPTGSPIAGPKFRVVPMKGLSYPYALAFLPDGDMLITERAGRLRIVRH